METLENLTVSKPVKPMTAKKFSKLKLSAKNTAAGLLAAHYRFLEEHQFLSEILEAYTAGELLPTPTLTAIQSLLFQHTMAADVAKAEAKIAQNIADYENSPKDKDGNVIISSIPSGNYLVYLMVKQYSKETGELIGVELGIIETEKTRIVEKDGKEVEEKYLETKPAIFGAETFMEAQNISDRKLVQREDSLYTEIENQTGEKKIKTQVHRNDAFARFFQRKVGTVMKITSKKNAPLRNKPKCVQTRVVTFRS